jgi:hypothetical protein
MCVGDIEVEIMEASHCYNAVGIGPVLRWLGGYGELQFTHLTTQNVKKTPQGVGVHGDQLQHKVLILYFIF